jgi:hypothetical protein
MFEINGDSKHHAMNTYGKVEVYFQAFLIMALNVSGQPLSLYPRGKLLRYLLGRRLSEPEKRSVAVEKKNLCPCLESNPDSWVLQPTA